MPAVSPGPSNVSTSVQTAADLTAVVTNSLRAGDIAYITSSANYWTLLPESMLPAGPTVIYADTAQGGASPGRWKLIPSGGGGLPTGDPNAVAYYDPTGTTLSTSPAFLAGVLSPLGAPQLWDFRVAGGKGAVWRQGAWTVAGDPSSVKGAGFVTYGSNATNAGPSATDGGEFLATPHSFGQYQIRVGINGGLPFPVCAWEDGSVDRPGIGPANQFVLYDDTAAQTLALDRPSGSVTLKVDVRLRRTGPAELTIDNGAAAAVDVLPAADKLGRIGTRAPVPGAKMWGEVNAFNIRAGDLHLQDDDRNAHWVLREEHDRILVTNMKTGKRYKMALIDLDEEKDEEK